MKTIANHSELKMNLQYFAEGEEDDFVFADETVEDVIVPDEETVEPEVETTETEETVEAVNEQPKIKVKFNHEEKELAIDEAIPLVQKGMNYDKLQERLQQLESDPRLTFIEQLANEEGMDVNEYIEAVRSHRENQRQQELISKGIPPDLAQEILESRKDREQRKVQETQKQQEERQNKEFMDFLSHFKQSNDRDFDPNKDKLPAEVWDAVNQGVPLKYAYLEHQTKEMATKLKVHKQNETNRNRAPVTSVTAHGSNESAAQDDFLRGFDSI